MLIILESLSQKLSQLNLSLSNVEFGCVRPNIVPLVFVLPSKFEPWGVVLHEIVTSGMPILVSDQVGSIHTFLNNNVNGMSFSYFKKEDFKNKLLKFMHLSDQELLKMGEESVLLSKKKTPAKWVETLNQIYE